MQTLPPTIKKRSYNPPSSTTKGSSSSRMALRNAAMGEIVEVQGGHIVRSTGRKDRHSKVCTAKGPRDRRVRLSAHTAIQFYDVQDRLGYDRPSKAVDWLIKKAKAAIDELDVLPPWKPIATILAGNTNKRKTPGGGDVAEEAAAEGGGGGGMFVGDNADSSSLLPPSLDSDAIADTIKSFFPMGGTAAEVTVATSAASSAAVGAQSMQFQSYPSADLLSRRGSSHSQDLKLSLQSFQDPMLIQSHYPHSHHQNQEEQSRLFPGATQIGFDNPSVWAENQQADSGRFQRLIGSNLAGGNGDSGGGSGGGGGFMFIPPQASQQPLLFGHGVGSNGIGYTATHFFSQRGPLQSSNTPLVRAWIGDNALGSTSGSSNQDYHQAIPVHPMSLSGIGYTSSGGFSGFHIPARIQGDEEEHDGNPNKPSSGYSGSRH